MKLLLPLLLLAFSVTSFANPSGSIGPCGTATLAVYEADYPSPASSACNIGILDYSYFSYHALSNAPSNTDILLTPGTNGFGFTQVGGAPFVASKGEIVQFEIDYTLVIDPAPVIGGADNRVDPPVGDVSIFEFFCNDQQYSFEGKCSGGNPQTLKVGTKSTGYPLSASIIFNPAATNFQTVGILFTLDGTNGVSSFDGLDTSVTLSPEPAYISLVGILLIAAGLKFRKRR